jgi:hypothetical protein
MNKFQPGDRVVYYGALATVKQVDADGTLVLVMDPQITTVWPENVFAVLPYEGDSKRAAPTKKEYKPFADLLTLYKPRKV